MKCSFTRTLRTPSSERFLVQIDKAADAAALELHYLTDGSVAGTLIVFDKQHAAEKTVAEILRVADETLLPAVSFEGNNLVITVVHGKVVGTFQSDQG